MANKRKHPVFIPDPRGTKTKSIYFDFNLEENKQKSLADHQQFINALIRKKL